MRCRACGEVASSLVVLEADGQNVGAAPACDKHLEHELVLGRATSSSIVQTPPPEPSTPGVLVRDRDGDRWRRGLTRWTCTAPVDDSRVTRTGRLHWEHLWAMYGPLEVIDRATIG